MLHITRYEDWGGSGGLMVKFSNQCRCFRTCPILPGLLRFGQTFPYFSRVSLVCVGRLEADIVLGLDDQPGGLRRTGASLRGCLYYPRPRFEREAVERPQQLCVRGNQAADDVSYTSNTHFEYPLTMHSA